jgi:hypothetical protein
MNACTCHIGSPPELIERDKAAGIWACSPSCPEHGLRTRALVAERIAEPVPEPSKPWHGRERAEAILREGMRT